ncbi:MAG: D-hexose-6-phosphate mutarotase [Campylobacterales bacterium]|nr:D-hexose-6-phosphate mutarotase [Campylobacterales bacterium]
MLTCKRLENGFEFLEITNDAATARIALQGAHLYHYARKGETPLLWVSACSPFEAGKAIRGGVPICWPWFGPHPSNPALPQHGFVRTALWQLHTFCDESASLSRVTLTIQSSDATRALWDFDFTLCLHVSIGETLQMRLETHNRSPRPMVLSQALHSYFCVDAIERVQIEGLEGAEYFDNLTRTRQKGTHQPLRIGEEVDRVYVPMQWPLKLFDGLHRIEIDALNSQSAVIWNPWKAKSATTSGMCPSDYQKMLCIECANAQEDARTLAPSERLSLECRVRIG